MQEGGAVRRGGEMHTEGFFAAADPMHNNAFNVVEIVSRCFGLLLLFLSVLLSSLLLSLSSLMLFIN